MAPRMDYEGYIQINKDRRFWTCLPYPPDTNAFLYYFMPRGKPSIAGELRLRLTSSGDPASFESGSDLLGTNGQPWSRPLPYLPRYYLPLYEKLREEELVSDGLDRVLSTLPSKFPSYRAPHRLYTLDDTFIIDFSCNRLYFHVITEKGFETMLFIRTFRDRRKICNGAPYTGEHTNRHLLLLYDYSHEFIGSALARFERSTLLEHEGTRTVVLRFLKIITPVKCVIPLYDGYICCPKEGELYQKKSGLKACQKVWSVDIDKPLAKGRSKFTTGLQLLWDA